MKLIALVVEKYEDVFEKQIFNFSDEFTVDFDFNKRELSIKENEDYITDFYGKSIYNITPIVGINGTGKTSVLKSLIHYDPWNISSINENIKYLLVFSNRQNNSLFVEYYGMDLTQCDLEDAISTDGVKPGNILVNNLFSNIDVREAGFILPKSWMSKIFKRVRLYNKNNDSSSREKGTIIRSFSSFKLSDLINAYDYLWQSDFIQSRLTLKFEVRKKFFQDEDIDNLQEKLSNLRENIEQVSISEWFTNKITDDELELLKNLLKSQSISISEYIDPSDKNQNFFIFISDKVHLNQEFIESYDRYDGLATPGRQRNFPTYKIEMSTGEANILEIVSNIINILRREEWRKHYIFLVDEIETGLHLEWSRKLIKFLIDYIECKRYEKYLEVTENIWKNYGVDGQTIDDINFDFPTFQFIFTTHSPFMLSDIKPGNIIALKKNDKGYSEVQFYEKDKEKDKLENTFARNIQEILRNNMFIENIYGEFAVQKINKMINHLNSDDKYDEEQQHRLKKEILLISEPLIRDKLLDMYHQKYSISSDKGVEKFLQSLNSLQLEQTQLDKIKKAYENSL